MTTSTRTHKVRHYSPRGAIGRRLAIAKTLHLEIQELQRKLDPHREFLLAHMNAQKLDRLVDGDFRVTRKTRHNWTYSPELDREFLRLRISQRWEQEQSIASDSPTEYTSFSFTPSSSL